jgi:hypothetical protein
MSNVQGIFIYLLNVHHYLFIYWYKISSESGKIGVTITTTPKTSPVAGVGPSSPQNISPPPAKVPRTTALTPGGRLSTTTGGDEPGPGPGPKTPRRNSAPPTNNSTSTTTEENNNNNGCQGDGDDPASFPPAEYWINKQPLADQIVITDVTVDSTTVTIRECQTDNGFFHEVQVQVQGSDAGGTRVEGDDCEGGQGSGQVKIN